MNFLLSTELETFGDSLRRFFSEAFFQETRRAAVERFRSGDLKLTASDEERWSALRELGVFHAGLREADGGLGFGQSAIQLVLEESARELCPLPLFESLVSLSLANVLVEAPLLPELVAKFDAASFRLTQATEHIFSAAPASLGISAKKSGDTTRVTGELSFVPSVPNARLLLVPFRGEQLFVIDLQTELASSITEQRLETLDLLRPFSLIKLQKTPAHAYPIKSGRLTEAKQLLQLFAVSEMVGASRHVLQITLDHVKTRKQFGRPVGSFQAVQHKLASVFVELEQVHALARFAGWAYDNDPPQFEKSAIAAKALAGTVLPRLCHEALQAHGGIAFTFDYELHLFLRRVKALSLLFGGTAGAYDALADRLLESSPARD